MSSWDSFASFEKKGWMEEGVFYKKRKRKEDGKEGGNEERKGDRVLTLHEGYLLASDTRILGTKLYAENLNCLFAYLSICLSIF